MSLRKLSTSVLRRELERREKSGELLLSRRAALARQLEALDAELAALGVGGAPARSGRKPGRPAGRPVGRPAGGPKGKRRRARNETSLPEAIVKVVKVGAEVTPADVAAKVKSGGYKSFAGNFGMLVSNALANDKRFKRVSRGLYKRVA